MNARNSQVILLCIGEISQTAKSIACINYMVILRLFCSKLYTPVAVFCQWETPEDLIGLIGLGFAAIAGIWAAVNVVTVINSLPFERFPLP